jgi:undecaprenyl-diphosphatase
MTIFQAIILGIVQGLTEFLPISSSGHLIIFPDLLGWAEQPLLFDTTMHLATALALILYFWKDLWKIATGILSDFFKNSLFFKNYSKEGILGLAIIAGVIPAGIIGLLFEDVIENTFRGVPWVIVFLILGSVLMGMAERFSKVSVEVTSVKRGFIVGLFQSLALLPGFSRSGSTISGGMLFGLNREQAAKFSFLLSIPIVLMAGLYQLVSSPGDLSQVSFVAITAGFTSSFLTGVIAINFLLKFVKTHTLYTFVIYRVLLALFLIFTLIL